VTDTNRKLQNEGKEVSDTFIHSFIHSVCLSVCFSTGWLCLLAAHPTEHQGLLGVSGQRPWLWRYSAPSVSFLAFAFLHG